MLLCILTSPDLCIDELCAMMRIHRVYCNKQISRSDFVSSL
jgi:hypothetical protein